MQIFNFVDLSKNVRFELPGFDSEATTAVLRSALRTPLHDFKGVTGILLSFKSQQLIEYRVTLEVGGKAQGHYLGDLDGAVEWAFLQIKRHLGGI